MERVIFSVFALYEFNNLSIKHNEQIKASDPHLKYDKTPEIK